MQMFQTDHCVKIQSTLKLNNWSSLIGSSLIQVNSMETDKIHVQSIEMKTGRGKWQNLSHFQLYVTIQCLTTLTMNLIIFFHI